MTRGKEGEVKAEIVRKERGDLKGQSYEGKGEWKRERDWKRHLWVSYANEWLEIVNPRLAHGRPVSFYLFVGHDYSKGGSLSLLHQT